MPSRGSISSRTSRRIRLSSRLEGRCRYRLLAQIMGIVDVFDALTTDRVYRAAMSYSEALDVIREEMERGLHDPELFKVFREIVDCV